MYELFLNVVWVFGIFFIVDVWRFVETHGRASVRGGVCTRRAFAWGNEKNTFPCS